MSELIILTNSFPLVFQGQPFATRLQARHGVPPYTWQATGLPTSFGLDSTSGEIESNIVAGDEVGSHTVTVTVTDDVGASAQSTLVLTIRPSTFRRTTNILLDPALQEQLDVFPASNTSRETVVSHFSGLPGNEILSGEIRAVDKFNHWANQIGFSDGPPSGTPPYQVDSLYDVVDALRTESRLFAEPVIIEVTQFDDAEISGAVERASGFSANSGFLSDNQHVVLLSADTSPDLATTDDSGYVSVAQRIQVPADANVQEIKIHLTRTNANQDGGIIVTIVPAPASPAETFSILGGEYAPGFGESPQTIVRGYIPISEIPVVPARSDWLATHEVVADLDAVSPFGFSPDNQPLQANTDYLLVVRSDFVDTGSPGQIQLAVSLSDSVLTAVPGSLSWGISGDYGSPNFGEAELVSPLNVRFPTYSPAASASSVGFTLQVSWDGATVGVVDLQQPNDLGGPGYDKYWVNANNANEAFKVIDGYNRTDSPVSDPLNFNELIDSGGNQAVVVALQTLAGDVVDVGDLAFVNSRGFMTSAGARLKISMWPETRGALPPVPFKILAGRERTLLQFEPDAFIRTANKTGSTDSEVLSKLSTIAPEAPLLSIHQVEPDVLGNVDLASNSSALSFTRLPSSNAVRINFNATLGASEVGGSPQTVPFDSSGRIVLFGGDNTELTVAGSTIRIDTDPGVVTINGAAPDGVGAVSLAPVGDSSQNNRVFVTVAQGGPSVVNIGTDIPDATTSESGFLSAIDKQRINELFGGNIVSSTTTGALSGGHAHLGTQLVLGKSVAGYANLNASSTIADAIELLNLILAEQFNVASEAGPLSTISTTYADFHSGYLADGEGIAYQSPLFNPGGFSTLVVAGSNSDVFRVVSNIFGDPGNSGEVGLDLGSTSNDSWETLEILSLTETYSAALAAVGGSPPNYTSVANYMEANPLKDTGSPTTKLDFQDVSYLGLNNVGAPVFSVVVQADPVLADLQEDGFNRIRMFHDTGATTRYSNTVSLFRDTYDGDADISVSSTRIGVDPDASVRFVSGVRHLGAEARLGLHLSADNLFNAAYSAFPAVIRDESAQVSVSIPYYSTTQASPQDATWIPSPEDQFVLPSPLILSQTVAFTVEPGQVASRELSLVVSRASQDLSPIPLVFADHEDSEYGRILHMGRRSVSIGSLTYEPMVSETYRLYPVSWGGTDFTTAYRVASPAFTGFVTTPSGHGVATTGTYGWPNTYPIRIITTENTWLVTEDEASAEERSELTFTTSPENRTSRPAMVCDLGLVHPGYHELHDYGAGRYLPPYTGDVNNFGTYHTDWNYYTDYAAVGSVSYYRVFRSGTAANQGRLRVWGYKRSATPDSSFSSYEGYSSPISSADFTKSWYNLAPLSPVPDYEGVSLELKLPGNQTTIHGVTPKGNPGKTGWLDMCCTPLDSLYAIGEDGYGALDVTGIVTGSGFVDIFWRTGSFTTGNTDRWAIVRLALNGALGKRIVITGLEMLNQSSATSWSSGI